MTIDVLPTVAGLIGAPLPETKIDGLDIWPLLSGKSGAICWHEAFYFYYHANHLEAMRSERWKLHFPHRYRSLKDKPGSGGTPGKYIQKKTELALYDLEKDIGEKTDVSSQYPDVVKRLQTLADEAREDLGDSATKQKGANVREPGRLGAGSGE